MPDGIVIHVDHWTEYQGFPVEDWQAEVAAGETRLGYITWIGEKIRMIGQDIRAMEE